MNKTPLTVTKQRFETKEKLVAAIEKLATPELWVDRLNDVKGLAKVSNAKLLRLHAALESAKAEFGTRAKLVASILELDKKSKDKGLQTRLEGYAVPRLLDLHRSAQRRAKLNGGGDGPVKAKPRVAKKAPVAKAAPKVAKKAPAKGSRAAKSGVKKAAAKKAGAKKAGAKKKK